MGNRENEDEGSRFNLYILSRDWVSQLTTVSNFPVRNWLLVGFIFLLPQLVVPIPNEFYPGRELTHYFQAVAFYRSGLESLSYVTLYESYAGIHIYSALMTPFVSFGYIEGGRLVSLLALLLTTYLVLVFTEQLNNPVSAILVGGLLVTSPYYMRFGYLVMPEALSILLTTSALYFAYKSTNTSERRYAVAAIALAGLAVFNHSWEAVIALPLVVLFLSNRDYKLAVVTGVLIGVSPLVVSQLAGTGQPVVDGLSTWTIVDSGVAPILNERFWGLDRVLYEPYNLNFVLLTPVAILLTGYFVTRWVSVRDHDDAFLAAWIASGLSIPFLLPGGAVVHMYYRWMIPVPVALGLGVVVGRRLAKHDFPTTTPRIRPGHIRTVALVGFLITASVTVGFGEYADTRMYSTRGSVSDENAMAAGYELRELGVTKSSQVTFVGDWQTTEPEVYVDASKVLVYARVDIRNAFKFAQNRRLPRGEYGGPKFTDEIPEGGECNALVVLDEEQIDVRPSNGCPASGLNG